MGIWDSIASSLTSMGVMASDIGTLGGISFRVSSFNDIFTYDNFSRSASARTSQHEIIGEKALTEYLGPGLQEISFSIKLHAQWGVNPLKEIERLIDYCESGTVLTFTMGGKRVGEHRWLIESVSSTAKYYDNRGNILSAEASVKLTEYVPPQIIGGTT
jgi:phage protein U